MKNYLKKYILIDGEVIEEPDLLTWGKWFETPGSRTIGRNKIGKIYISTVFLGIDHNFGCGGPPILFETMIFKGKHDKYQERYRNLKDAKEGHLKAVELVENSKMWRRFCKWFWEGL